MSSALARYQRAEIEDSVHAFGEPPMALLLRALPSMEGVVAVHCTHTRPEDLSAFIGAGGAVCLCPLTEANLGDGLPDLASIMGVELVRFAFAQARQGDLFIKKAPASTIQDLVTALLELFDVPGHEVKVIGWRHAEKLYETLASQQELATAEDLGEYWRLQLDERDLNYSAYFSEGDTEHTPPQEDFHSHNTERLDVAGVVGILEGLPQFRALVAAT